MRILEAMLLAMMMLSSSTALAQAAGEVVALNAPAFLVRGGVTRPLEAGAALEPGDVLRTGADARVLLRMAEGSDVKLGADAEFAVRVFEQRSDGVFGGLLDVLRGAFRFTTSLVSGRHQRDLQVRVATVTAGIRGTDIWGRANEQRDLVCLIEGNIRVRHIDGAVTSMDEPLTFYVAPRGQAPLPVQPVDAAQLAQWATETELLTGYGVVEPGGRYSLNLHSSRERDHAVALQTRLRDAGYAATVAEVQVAGTTWHRVSVHDFAAAREAASMGERLAIEFALRGAWVQGR